MEKIMKRLLLLVFLFGSFSHLMAMDKPLPTVVLNRDYLCGKCGFDFGVEQNGAQLSPCGCVIHDRCVPQLFYSEKVCPICDAPTNYFKKNTFKFAQPVFKDKIINRSELSPDLDPLILARSLAKTNIKRLREIDTNIKEYNVLMDAYNKRSKDLTNQIVQSYMFRDYLVKSLSVSAGLIGIGMAYKLMSNPSFIKALIPAGLMSLTTYYFGNAWNDRLLDATVSNITAKNNELDAALKALREPNANNKN